MAPKLLSILLQRNDCNIPWGFKLSGGKELGRPLGIVKVDRGTLAAQYLSPGDIIHVIQGQNANTLLHIEAEELVRKSGKMLELLVQKIERPYIPSGIISPEPILDVPLAFHIAPRPLPVTRPISCPVERSVPLPDIVPRYVPPKTPPPVPEVVNRQQSKPSPNTELCNDPKTYVNTGFRSAKALRQHFERVISQDNTDMVKSAYMPQPVRNESDYVRPRSVDLTPCQSFSSIGSTTDCSDDDYFYNIWGERMEKHANESVFTSCHKDSTEQTLTTSESDSETVDDNTSTTTEETQHSKDTVDSLHDSIKPEAVASVGCSSSEERPTPVRSPSPRASRSLSPELHLLSNRSDSLYRLVLSKSLSQLSPADFEKMRSESGSENGVEEGDDGEEEESDDSTEEDDEDDTTTEEEANFDYEEFDSSTEWVRYDSDYDGDEGEAEGYWEVPAYLRTQSAPVSRSSSDETISSRRTAPSSFREHRSRRQSSQLSGGESTPSPGPPSAPASGDGVSTNSTAPSFPPAPPPPPPPAPGQLPAVRISTEIPESRGPREPPAAIQNAMMTKDKKPFTYTPGGLDLSQIRSPRMARRITRNANAEGVTGENVQASGPKTSPLAQAPPPGSLPPSAVAAMQPQMAVPVFPTGGGMPQLHHVNVPPGSHYNEAPLPPPSQHMPPPPPPQPVSNSFPKNPAPVIRPVQAEPPKPASTPSPTVTKSQPSVIQYSPPPPPPTPHNEPGSIYVPPVTTTRAQVGSIYIPPINNNVQQESISSSARQPPTPQSASPLSPIQLNKAPTPWLSQQQRQQQQSLPPWANREESQQQRPLPPQQQQQQQQPGIRIIPIQVEGRNEPVTPPKPPQPVQSPTNQPHTRIIPIQIEGASTNGTTQQQQQQQQRRPVYVHNKFNPPQSPQTPATPSPAPYSDSHSSEQNARQLQQQHSWGPSGGNGGPIQSRSFRVLQKITDTDNTEGQSDQEYGPSSGQWNSQGQGVPVQQLHKLQLNDDDRALMNRFKAQVSEEAALNEEENPRYRGGHIPSRVFRMLDESVDEDSFLHNESDPRYRGPVIPSRAFRMLQNMTDGTSEGVEQQVPRGPAVARGPQARPSQTTPTGEASPQPYVPPSEQQVQEPRKYTGGAIPSRSFRMLQAMTAPENCGPGQSDM